MIHTFKACGIVLKRTNLGEADKVVTLYTQHQGKIRVLAKGIRRITSRKGGNLELFRLVTIFLAKGKNLDLITEVEVINSFISWRKNLTKVAVAYYFCELVDQLTPQEQENRSVYDLLVESLGKIDSVPLKPLVRQFEHQLLDNLGFGVPAKWREQTGSLQPYIESIIEKKINSPKILHDLCS